MADTKIVPFLFEGEIVIRVCRIDGADHFIAKDVCGALGIRDVSNTVAKLDPDEKGTASIHTPGGQQDLLTVTESGLYTLILRSRDAMKRGTVAHRFRKWVTSEVLPALRQAGRYEAPKPEQPAEPAAQPARAPSWAERSIEDRRIELQTMDRFGRYCSHMAAWWYGVNHAGLPLPPRHMQPQWQQTEMDLRTREETVTTVSITRGSVH